MVHSFAQVRAVVAMRRADYFRQGSRGLLRLHEKDGKRQDVPAHHRAAEALPLSFGQYSRPRGESRSDRRLGVPSGPDLSCGRDPRRAGMTATVRHLDWPSWPDSPFRARSGRMTSGTKRGVGTERYAGLITYV